MAALAWDLRHIAPDLAGQFEQSAPGARRNTGSGLLTQTLVSSRRPLSAARETGRFGTVHAMVGTLPDPVAFQVELLNGRLVALHGDAYGQDTRGIDFERVGFEQVFTVNANGQSVLFEAPTAIPAATTTPPLRHFPAAPRPTGAVSTPSTAPAAETAATPDLPSPEDGVSVLIGLWVMIAAAAVLAVLIFGIPAIGAVIVAVWLAAAVRRPKVLAAIQRGLAAWKAARAVERA